VCGPDRTFGSRIQSLEKGFAMSLPLYSAARGAQLAYVQAVGVELAPHRVQVNAIAQNFVDNPIYFPPQVQANPRFQERLAREVPLGRLVAAREDAQYAAYLCSRAADCFVGQVFPVCGGWVAR
jgi:2-keto-3-deoxy-L-fuconate dehydrogenase